MKFLERRNISKIAFLSIILLSSCSGKKDEQFDSPIKNVVFILADDHTRNVTGTYGNKLVRTPNIDKLAKEGITFENAYCNAPICSASRASILTGKYPHATGVNLLFTPFPDEGNETIAEHLQKENYNTALFGKTHFNNSFWGPLYENGLPKHGFDTIIDKSTYKKWLSAQQIPSLPDDMEFYTKKSLPVSLDEVAKWMNSDYSPHAVYDEFSIGTFFADQAIEFLDKNKEEPFFLWLSFHEPHHPYYFPIEFADLYDPDSLSLPKGSLEDDQWIPEKFKKLTDHEKRGIIASYYSSMSYMDKNIGLVMESLKKLGLDESTLVIYASDNGYLLNDHKRFEKHTLWEESVKQPLIIKSPGQLEAGKRMDFIAQYIDLVPTILGLIDAKPLEGVQGIDLSNHLTNNSSGFDQVAFAEYLEDNLAMVVNGKWKYVFSTGRRDLGISYATGNGPSGLTHRLYNLDNDPNETTNLANHDGYASILNSLKKEMLTIFKETHPDAYKCPNKLSMDGQLVWFCEPRDIGADQMLEDKPYPVFYK